jgi:hypothetical protein
LAVGHAEYVIVRVLELNGSQSMEHQTSIGSLSNVVGGCWGPVGAAGSAGYPEYQHATGGLALVIVLTKCPRVS